VPPAVYIVFMVMMGIGACASFLLMPPAKVIRDDGTQVATVKARGFMEELKSNLEIFRDWKLLIMVSESKNTPLAQLNRRRFLLFCQLNVSWCTGVL
jgi:hypothetical protein